MTNRPQSPGSTNNKIRFVSYGDKAIRHTYIVIFEQFLIQSTFKYKKMLVTIHCGMSQLRYHLRVHEWSNLISVSARSG